jgi:hypothetical protein
MAEAITFPLQEPGSTITMTQMIRVGTGTTPVPANITQGIANRITPEFESTKTQDHKATSKASELPNVFPNILENFATINHLFTFACLTKEQHNDPASYRNNPGDLEKMPDGKGLIVFASAGRYDASRVRTYHGTPEYFVDNFIINNVISSGPQNGVSPAANFTFDVYEPYSLGILLESMQNAAVKAGYSSYGEAPFLMRIDFQGYGDDGTELSLIKSKYFPIRLTTVKFKANESGSTYKVTAVPYNHIGFSGLYNTLYTDVKLVAAKESSVAELLKTGEGSLVNYLNELEASAVKNGQRKIKNIFDIQFPPKSADHTSMKDPESQLKKGDTASKATFNPYQSSQSTTVGGNTDAANGTTLMNDIGLSTFDFTEGSGGIVPMARAGVAFDEKTAIIDKKKVNWDKTTRAFQFPGGMSVTDVISQTVLSSSYIRNAIEEGKKTNGMVKYFMIDVQVELLEYDIVTNDFAKKVTFRVVPYSVDQAMFSNPAANLTAEQHIKLNICKGYEYIYTGKNTDILKFDIEVNNLFFKPMNPSTEQITGKGTKANPDQGGIVDTPMKQTNLQVGAKPENLTDLHAPLLKNPAAVDSAIQAGGSGIETTEMQIAKAYHEAFIDSGTADMVKLNLEILGDPYWLSDHGIGNYYVEESTDSSLKTKDGTMNYQDAQVYVYLRFRSPIDVNTTYNGGDSRGLYLFASDDVAMKENDFSGIYRVTRCESIFSGGVFKQKLTCLRQPKLSVDAPKTGNDTTNNAMVNLGGDQPLPSSLNEQMNLAIPPETTPTPTEQTTSTGQSYNIIDRYKPEDKARVTKMLNSQPGSNDPLSMGSVLPQHTTTSYNADNSTKI